MTNSGGKALLCATAVAAMVMTGSAWAHERGRMTGGGSFFCPYLGGTLRITHGFELHCKRDNEPVPVPNNLEVNFSGGDNFHLTSLDKALCSNLGEEEPPSAGFNTFEGAGPGTFNQLPAYITFTFTDNGEPGTKDTARITITRDSAAGAVVLTCPPEGVAAPFLIHGNHQAHRATGSKR